MNEPIEKLFDQALAEFKAENFENPVVPLRKKFWFSWVSLPDFQLRV